ncbi:MAG: serine hydrolase [Chloroflexi bacterium]|nr:MAG: serine hydrolase [Chloroflexota bacterium]TME43125.1 MAG: serine hydrolase [Chloroflexota bacterium]
MHTASRILVAAGVVFIALAPPGTDVLASTPVMTLSNPPAVTLAVVGTRQLVLAVDNLVTRSPMTLTAAVEPLVQEAGGAVGIALIELGGATPLVWSYNGSEVFTAASTYKLAALMMEAQNIAAGQTNPDGLVCYEADDYEAGWFDDYADGMCFTRSELAQRAGHYSDNTAGHMLVRDLGGADALNAWAASAGATESVFFTSNTTSAADLALLWAAEAKGSLGGAAAQAWLYPMLTGTSTEAGIPSGVSARSVVVHKTGTIDQVENDAALVISGPNGAYVLTVMTDGVGGAAGWQLIAELSSQVWNFETARA